MSRTYDAIVIGTGGVGSAALMHLARRGVRALGLDRYPAGHDRGSSHGRTRVIRKAYFEHPDYVPLLARAYELWGDLEATRGERLFHRAGLLEVGPPDGGVISGVLKSARQYGLHVDELTRDEVLRRFPGFVIPEGAQAVFEHDAGFLLVERCVMAHLEEAQRLGAQLGTGEAVTEWAADGAWSNALLGDLGVELRVVRKHQHWFATDDARYRLERGCPAFFYELPGPAPLPQFYGMPWYDDYGVKLAEHTGGDEVADPTTLDRSPDEQDRRRVEAFLRAHLPGVSTSEIAHAGCMYTLSTDEHFIVDRHPRYPQVVFAAGLSGHGFKFSSVLGEVLAELVLDGCSTQPIGFLSLGRLR